jgi:uncharacterized ion transporter superfamily protein YfcC
VESRAGAHIGRRAFYQSALILLALMIIAGVLTYLVPAGSYDRTAEAGREMIIPESFHYTPRPDYPAWRWVTAPLEVLGSSSGAIVIVIIVFLLMVGAAFALLDQTGLLRHLIGRLVQAFGGRKYLLLLSISLFFMLLGAFFGIFEEIVPLVPLMIALSYYLGWDALTGLGMSILATNLGFSAAITNPFTIGVAQKLAELPLFSGAWLRLLIFIVIYIVFAIFITRYAQRIERQPELSPVYKEDSPQRARYGSFDLAPPSGQDSHLTRAGHFLTVCLGIIILLLVSSPFIQDLSDFLLPLVGLLFLIGGIGAGMIVGMKRRILLSTIGSGVAGIAPAIPLILMAASVKHIVEQGGVMDTLLHSASTSFSQSGAFIGSLFVYGLALFIEFFIGSGSAKAFLLMPILLPLGDLIGVTRQITVTAYCFGDGFSNLVYPTNPVLLISLGLTVVSYPKWLRWSLGLWIWIVLITVAFLGLATVIGYGPF